jgi:hypothetical protein
MRVQPQGRVSDKYLKLERLSPKRRLQGRVRISHGHNPLAIGWVSVYDVDQIRRGTRRHMHSIEHMAITGAKWGDGTR